MAIIVLSLIAGGCGQSQATTPTATTGSSPATTAASSNVYQWKMETFLSTADSDHSVAYAKFCEIVAKNTSGQIKITLFSAGAIVATDQLLNATRDGILEMSVMGTSYTSGAIPVTGVIGDLPFSWRNVDECIDCLNNGGLSEITRPAYTNYGVQLLGHHPISEAGLGMLANKPIATLSDLKGLKVRTYGLFVDFWQTLGASTVSIPLAETYTALSTGVADAVTTDWTGQVNFKFYEVLKDGVLPSQASCGSAQMLVNPKAWNSLWPDLQTAMNTSFKEFSDYFTNDYYPNVKGTHEKAIQDLQDKGVTFTTLSDADQETMLNAAMAIWDKAAAKDELSAQGVALIKDYYKKLGRIK